MIHLHRLVGAGPWPQATRVALWTLTGGARPAISASSRKYELSYLSVLDSAHRVLMVLLTLAEVCGIIG